MQRVNKPSCSLVNGWTPTAFCVAEESVAEDSSSAACSESHVLNDSQSRQGFTDVLGAHPNEITLSIDKPTSHFKENCASCGVKFKYIRGRGFQRYTLTSLNLENAAVSVNGSHVCGPCRNFYRRKPVEYSTHALSERPLYENVSDGPAESDSRSVQDEAAFISDALEDHSYTKPAPTTDEPEAVPSSDHTYCQSKPVSDENLQGNLLKRPCDTAPVQAQKRRTSSSKPKVNGHAKRTAFKDTMISLLKRSKYERALNVMYSSSNRAVKKAVSNFISKVVRQEVNTVVRNTAKQNILSQKFTSSSLSKFKWEDAIGDIESDMPVSIAAVSSLFPDKLRVSKVTTVGRRGRKR